MYGHSLSAHILTHHSGSLNLNNITTLNTNHKNHFTYMNNLKSM